MRDPNEFNIQNNDSSRLVSQMDGVTPIDLNHHVLTMIRENGASFLQRYHAALILEGVKSNGEYFIKKIHLIGIPITRKSDDAQLKKTGCALGFKNNGIVEIKDLTGKQIKYFAKSNSWSISKESSQYLLDNARNSNNTHFNVLGSQSVVALPRLLFSDNKQYNCIDWAIYQAKLAGINLPQDHINFITYSPHYTTDQGAYTRKPYAMKELCMFAKDGDVISIKKFYDKKYDVNQLTDKATAGIIEMSLGHYTPLMLAAGYGKLEVVQLLVNEYSADILQKNTKSWRHVFFNALDCAKNNWFGLVKRDLQQQQQIINFLEYKLGLKDINILDNKIRNNPSTVKVNVMLQESTGSLTSDKKQDDTGIFPEFIDTPDNLEKLFRECGFNLTKVNKAHFSTTISLGVESVKVVRINNKFNYNTEILKSVLDSANEKVGAWQYGNMHEDQLIDIFSQYEEVFKQLNVPSPRCPSINNINTRMGQCK